MTKNLTPGQRDYEAKRAAKAGMSLDRWLAQKEKDRAQEALAKAEATKPPAPPKTPGFVSRLLQRAEKPL